MASIWLTTGASVLHPAYRTIGHGYLAALGLPDALMWVTCAFEVALGVFIGLRPPSTWLATLQVGMVAVFSAILAIHEPMLLAHPFGVITKNLPFGGLVIFAWLEAREGLTARAVTLLRVAMALIWITEGLIPKILFQQPMELQVVRASGLVPIEPGVFLRCLGAAQVASGIAVLTLGGWARRWLVWGQLLALFLLPPLVSLHQPELWVHPFGPMTKNLPMIAGTYLVLCVLPPDPFLAARWSHLAMFHFTIPRELALRHMPEGVEPDLRDGEAWASFVCLEFHETAVLGVPAPFSRRFSDVNLRIYARRGDRHGVVFVREIASSPLVSLGAKVLYGEPFVTARIATAIAEDGDSVRAERRITRDGATHVVRLHAKGAAEVPAADTDAHFFKERAWGFGRTRTGKTAIYAVEHPLWAVRPVVEHHLDVDFVRLYGSEWTALTAGPRLVHFALGSRVVVYGSRAA